MSWFGTPFTARMSEAMNMTKKQLRAAYHSARKWPKGMGEAMALDENGRDAGSIFVLNMLNMKLPRGWLC